jgi:signal transduction histidine kinase
LLAPSPAQARTELSEILGLARQALADVRSMASGSSRELPLDKESQSAESVLTAADVQVRMELDHEDLPVRVRTVLAVVLREGVTNVLRHSKASWCDIVLRQVDGGVCLAIVNDGVPVGNDTTASGTPSSGIRNLSERVAKLGGELDCGPDEDSGDYRLRVSLPVQQELPDDDPA